MNNSVHIKWNELAASYSNNKQASLDRLVYYASNAWEFRTRNNAFNALKNLNYCDDSLVAHLFDALLSTNSRLAGPAAQLLDYFAQQNSYKNKFKTYYQQHKWASWQSELLKKQISFL